jgi:hypothetical protein
MCLTRNVTHPGSEHGLLLDRLNVALAPPAVFRDNKVSRPVTGETTHE